MHGFIDKYRFLLTVSVLLLMLTGLRPIPDYNGSRLFSQFTSAEIEIDGLAEDKWADASPSDISIA